MTVNQLADAALSLRTQARACNNSGHRERLHAYADCCMYLATGDSWFFNLIRDGQMALLREEQEAFEESLALSDDVWRTASRQIVGDVEVRT